ncbi:hypothetical protein [Paenibacillus sp. GCM10012303]|uniref:hypothetical protein n=1 Tax=Paenibacillus sp. GCM10012303 TaxID=3317340 RepID=UPI0036245318
MLETIKSYLVSLGFAVDKSSYDMATKTIDGAGDNVAKFAGGAVKNFALAGTAIASFVVAANVGIAKFIGDLARADLENEKLARQMWTTKENAAAFNDTLKAMGATLEDLYLSPELMRNFETLRKEVNNMRPPPEFADQMRFIRSIQFEFTRLKLEATYALQWIGYYLVKYLGEPLTKAKAGLAGINDAIIKNMPVWTKDIARVLSWFVRMGETIFRAGKGTVRIFDEIGEKIPANIKLIGAAIAALGLIIASGPVGMFATALVGLILLLDDFYTYIDGGEAAFGPMWQKLLDLFDLVEGSETFEKFKSGFKDAMDSVSVGFDNAREGISAFYQDLVDKGAIDNLKETFSNTTSFIHTLLSGAKEWTKDLYKELKDQGVLTELKKSASDLFTSLTGLSAAWSGLLDEIIKSDEAKKALEGIGSISMSVLIGALETVSELLGAIAGYISWLSAALDGSIFKKAETSSNAAQKRLEESGANDMGFWGKMWKATTSMFSSYFTGDKFFQDVVRAGGGNIIKSLDPQYLYQAPPQNNSTSSVSLQQTNNIYGSDPQATADAAQDNMESMYMRSMRGVIR